MPYRSLIKLDQTRPAAVRYCAALVSVAVALGVRMVLTPYLGNQIPYTSFFLAVVVSAWFGGFGPGVLAAVVAAIAGWHLFLDSGKQPFQDWLAAFLFISQAALVSYIVEAMRASRQRITAIVDSISDGFAVFDKDWRIVYLNEHGAEMANCAPKELLGRSLWKLFPAVVGTEFWTKLHQAMREQRPVRFEFNPPGRDRWFEHTAYPSLQGLTLYTRDVTDRKKAGSELEAAKAEIEQLNADLELRVHERTAQLNATVNELEAFSYTVSHDLRAPLRAIDGFSRLLFEDYQSKLDDEGRRLLDVIRNSTVKMGRLVDGLLAFSRLGRQAISSSFIDMSELAREAFNEANAAEEGRNVRFVLNDLPPAIGDRVLLRQVFINLFSNALKFTRGRDPAIIEAGFRTEGEQNIFFVKDNGAGFDMRYVDKLFGVFQRLHAVTEFEGTGLGLAIVQRVVHRHGGRAWAEGEPGRGARIYFSLPRVKSEDVENDLPRTA